MKKTITLLLAFPVIVFSQEQKINSPIQPDYSAYFQQAYQQYSSIPKGILEALAYTNTHIQHITHNPNDAESCVGLPNYYGVMGLVQDGKNYFRNNLVTVSQMSGISEQEIISSPEKNILAYAAAYAQAQNSFAADVNLPNGKSKPETQIPILVSLSELPDNGSLQNNFVMNTHLYSVLSFMNNPDNAAMYNFPEYKMDLENVFGEENYKILSASSVIVSDEKISDKNGNEYEFDNSFPQSQGNLKTDPSVMSADYAPAIWNAAASCNYSSRTAAVTAVTIHDVEGSYSSCISWFQNCASGVSAHYVVRSSDGQITQMVLESKKAWHVGSENGYTIGIEHEGYANQTGWYTTAMYNASANLVKDICNSGYGINPTTAYNGPACNCHNTLSSSVKIKGHQHYAGTSKVDPGPNWNWYTFYNLINGSPPPPPPTPPANDNCSAAISLTPNTTCVSTAGTIANATTSGLLKASCDVSSSSSLKDVWYKFTATASTSTVTLTPSAGLDGVLSLYTSCTSGQIGCSDNGGGPGGIEKINASGLTVGSTYYIRIYSYGASTPSTSTFNICVTAPAAVSCGVPSGLSASSVTSSSATLNWGSVSGANSYNVRHKKTSLTTWTTTTSTTASKAISGLSSSTAYEFQVQAVCSNGNSAFSASKTFTTTVQPSTIPITITVGNGNSAYSAHPYGTIYMDERTEYIITKSELTAAGWTSSAPNLKSIAFNVISAAAQSMNSFSITMAHTANSSFASTTFLTGTNSTSVYSGTVAATTGWNTYNFSTPFAYNGTDNLLIKICWNNSSFTSNSSVQATSYANYMALYYRADVASGGVCSQSTGTQSFYRPNTKMTFSSGSTPPPPPAVDCNKTLKTTIEGFNVYQHNASGAIMFKAKFAVDADGSPRAYGPNNSGLDYTANAGHPGNWWGVVTDANGNPIIQNSSNPFPGMYVSTTSLYSSSYAVTNPLRYVNAETVPFFVLPAAVKSIAGIVNGDIAYVYNTTNGMGCYAVLADQGPAGKLGEGSIYLADQLGINSNPKTGGTSSGIIDYIVFPNSGYGQGTIPTIAQINSIGTAKINSVGGTGITSCLPIAPPVDPERKIDASTPFSVTENELTIFPNPSDGKVIYGKFAGEGNMHVKIYDVVGREIFSKQISVENGEFSLSFSGSNLKSGMYMLVGTMNDKQYTKRVVVK